MADLNAPIKPKKSSTAGEVPQAADLEVAEIAVNTADGKLFVKHTDNSIKEISGSGDGAISSLGSIGDVIDYTALSPTGTWSQEIVSQTTGGSDFPDASGEWAIYENSVAGEGFLMVSLTDSNAVDQSTLLSAVAAAPASTYSFRLNVNGGASSALVPVQGASLQGGVRYRIDFDATILDPAQYNEGGYSGASPSTGGNGPFGNTLNLELKLSSAFQISDGQVLTWVSANSQWEPADAAGGGAVTILDDVGDVQYYVPPGSYDGLTDSTGSTSSASLTTSGQWFVSTNPAYFNFHQDQSTEMSLLQTGDEVTFEAYGLSHTTTLTTSPVAGSGVIWYFQVSPTFPAAWKGPTLPSGQALKVINNTRFPNTTPDDPLDKQALIWNGTDSEWQPTSTIQSVNGQIGDAVIGVEELDSYAGWLKYNVISSGSLLPDAGEAIIDHASGWDFYLSTTDADGTSDGGGLDTLANGDPGQIILNNGTLVDVTVNSIGNSTGSRLTVNFVDDSFLSSVSDSDVIYIQFASKAYGLSAADGQVLTWVDASNQWEPVDAPADAVASVNGETGVVSLGIQDMDDFQLTPSTIWEWDLYTGNGSIAAAWGYVGTVAIKINKIDANGVDCSGDLFAQSTPFTLYYTDSTGSGTVSVSLVSYLNAGTGEIQLNVSGYNGTGSGTLTLSLSASGLPPTDGQVLTWVDANSKWEPADAPADAVSSVNGQTGVVSLGLSDLSDVSTATGGTPFRYNNEVAGSASVVADGDWVYTSGIIVFDHIDADGQDATTGLYNQLSATGNPSSGSIWVSTDGVTFTEEAYTATFDFGGTGTRYGIAIATSYSGSGEIWIAATEPITQASDGQVLTWVDTNSQWEPADLQGAAIRTALGIGEYVDDAAAGTGGVASGALYYNTTSSDYRLKT